MSHPNAELLKNLYTSFSSGDLPAALALCGDEITFQVSGKSRLAGKYNKDTFGTKLVAGLMELSDGTFNAEVHDILASDLHGTVLLTASLVRNGEKKEYRAVHVWRFQNGKPIAWYDYPRDLYQFDAIWG